MMLMRRRLPTPRVSAAISTQKRKLARLSPFRRPRPTPLLSVCMQQTQPEISLATHPLPCQCSFCLSNPCGSPPKPSSLTVETLSLLSRLVFLQCQPPSLSPLLHSPAHTHKPSSRKILRRFARLRFRNAARPRARATRPSRRLRFAARPQPQRPRFARYASPKLD
eukprot:2147689-Pleurochrysis_carterae.AAC.2